MFPDYYFLLNFEAKRKMGWGFIWRSSPYFITYFILMKGIKGTPYAKQSFEILNGSTIANFMETQVILISHS